MTILTQFQELLGKSLKGYLSDYLYNMINGFNNPYSIDSYKQFIEDFDKFTANFTIQTYEVFILSLDDEFMQSSSRKQAYESKGFLTKPLLTKFGWINFKRRKYRGLSDGKTFMFIDRFLGLVRYNRFDPFVISDLCEEAAINNSYAKAGKIVSKTIGNKVKYDADPNKNQISRATARNNVIKASKIVNEPSNETFTEIKTLNILLDEKFVGSQFNEKKDHMVKAAVVFERYKKEYKGRIRLTGKHVFASIDDDLLKQVMDYIYFNYDTNKLKTINIMGDGAKWIKSFASDYSFKYHKNLKIIFGLDGFHLAQAIQIITTNKYKDSHSKFILKYIINNKKDYFLKVCESLIKLNPHREEKIREQVDYILNNWEYIQNSFHKIKFKCSMESTISHVLADIFTSRPKAYSKPGLRVLLKIRLLYINGYDFKNLYFESLKQTQQEEKENKIIDKVINKTKLFNDTLYSGIPYMHSASEESKKLRTIINHTLYNKI